MAVPTERGANSSASRLELPHVVRVARIGNAAAYHGAARALSRALERVQQECSVVRFAWPPPQAPSAAAVHTAALLRLRTSSQRSGLYWIHYATLSRYNTL